MVKFISRREIKFEKHYERRFRHKETKGWSGYSFPCNDQGELLDAAKHAARVSELEKDQRYEDEGVYDWQSKHVEPAVIECEACGAHVTLHGFTNTCGDCQADYNMSGQQLAPRAQWGEETGESLDEILAADSDREDCL